MDAVVKAAFRNTRRLLQIYIIIPHSQVVVERMFSKMKIFERAFQNIEMKKQLSYFKTLFKRQKSLSSCFWKVH